MEDTIFVFAARYAHGRNTGAPYVVMAAIKHNWPYLSDHTKEQLVKESHEAQYQVSLWQEFRDWAKEQ